MEYHILVINPQHSDHKLEIGTKQVDLGRFEMFEDSVKHEVILVCSD